MPQGNHFLVNEALSLKEKLVYHITEAVFRTVASSDLFLLKTWTDRQTVRVSKHI